MTTQASRVAGEIHGARELLVGRQPRPAHAEGERGEHIGAMPMSTLAAFAGMSIDHHTLDQLVERLRDRRS